MIFNKNNRGSEELRALTGSYYNNNNFDKMVPHIEIVKEDVIKIINKDVYARAENAYVSDNPSELDKMLVNCVQLPIAIFATLRMYQRNDISHEDTGRKVKIDKDNESIPWEWQLDNDNKLHLDDYYKAVDRLISLLDENENDITEWKDSDAKKLANSLLIKNADQFDEYYPIERSGRMYVLLLPFIREAERRYIKKVLGDDYERFVTGKDLTEEEKDMIRDYVCPPIPLIAISIALRRLPLGLIPIGVVRNYTSASQTMHASEPAELDDIYTVSGKLMAEAQLMINELKQERNPSEGYQLIPNNCRCNKYMQV